MSRYRKGLRLNAAPADETQSSITDAINGFLAYHHRKGSSCRYIEELRSYLVGNGRRSNWIPLEPWTQRNGLATLADLTRESAAKYLSQTRDQATRYVYFKVCCILGSFFRYLVTEGLLERAPLQIIRPRRPQTEFRIFTPEEMRALASVVRRETARDWAIFLLFLDTGLRSSEICSLKMSDLHLERAEIEVRAVVSKNGRSRTIPLTGSVQALKEYLRTRPASETCDWLFLSFYSTPVYSGGVNRQRRRATRRLDYGASPLTRIGLYQLVRKWGSLAGLTESRSSPHTFRHYFATQYLCKGGNIATLQRLLGHSRLDVTERYLKISGPEARDAHSRFSPALDFLTTRTRLRVSRIASPV
jgi:integrase